MNSHSHQHPHHDPVKMIGDPRVTAEMIARRESRMSQVLKRDPQGRMWYSKYKTIDFVDGGRTAKAVDCWGLLFVIYAQELGIILPSYDDIPAEELQKVTEQINEDSVQWPWVEVTMNDLEPFDAVVVRGLGRTASGRYGWYDGHVGIITEPPFMMHIKDDSGILHQPILDTPRMNADEHLRKNIRRVGRYMDW